MCLIVFSLNSHPTYKLILGANRDEFFSRQTAPAAYWNDAPSVLGGRDLEAQGTWMAMNRKGKIAMVTNYRDPAAIDPNAPSRGKLVSDYLIDENISAEDYLNAIDQNAKKYNGFNLIIGNPDELFYFSNYKPGIFKIGSGLHGLSNHLLETPWPKVTRAKEKFAALLVSPIIPADQLLDILYDERQAADDQLPSTGIPHDREKALSAMFIKTSDYGTRCSTVIMINRKNEVVYSERQYDLTTYGHRSNVFEFKI